MVRATKGAVMSRSFRSSIAVLLVVFALLPAAAHAGDGRQPLGSGSVVRAALSLLSTAWSRFSSLWSDNGCELDPDGHCLAAPVATLDNGCEADPDGSCLSFAPTITSDNGCSIEPNGNCQGAVATPTSDNGCWIEPNGRCVI